MYDKVNVFNKDKIFIMVHNKLMINIAKKIYL